MGLEQQLRWKLEFYNAALEERIGADIRTLSDEQQVTDVSFALRGEMTVEVDGFETSVTVPGFPVIGR